MEHALELHTRIKRLQEGTIDTKGRGSEPAVAETVAMAVARALEAIKERDGAVTVIEEDMLDVVKKAKTTAVEVVTVIGPMSVTASGARAGVGQEAPVPLPVEGSVLIILGVVVTAEIDLPIPCTILKKV